MILLETISGKRVNVLDPQPDTIDIQDIAWALSRIPRFAGHTIPYIPYTVAQHSIGVMKELAGLGYGYELLMHGLLHDAAEAYIGDIPSPIKQIPGFKEKIKEIENNLLEVVYRSLGLPIPNQDMHDIIKHADRVQRAVEAYNFVHSRGADWNLPAVTFKKLQEFESPKVGTVVYDEFLSHYNELRKLIK